MSIFNTILEKLGIGKPKTTTTTKTKPTYTTLPRRTPLAGKTTETAGAMPMVDVMSKLEGLAAKNPLKLDWKKSIADLLYLLGIDNSLQARKNLATELGCPKDLMEDSAKMNMWLHKTVLRKISENGGNIPRELLD